MIRSMTGYGRAEHVAAQGRWSVELRSVNHRYCEISLRLPRFAQHLENRVRTYLQDALVRGKITANVNFEGQLSTEASSLHLDFPLMDRYHALLTEAKTRYKLDAPIDVRTLATLPDVFLWDAGAGDDEGPWAELEKALEKGCREITRMKDQEGGALAKDLRQRVNSVLTDMEAVEVRAPLRIEEARKRLGERLAQLLEGGSIDPNRLAQEVALYVDRMDCTEECVRLRAHCNHFNELLDAVPSAGRKLNFLSQEMHREANTIGSKGNDSVISHKVLQIKEELEKIREQIQNIE